MTQALGSSTDHSVRRTVLPGGLRVVTQHVPGMRSASVGIWVGTGSRDEEPGLAGAAHYLEHLLFKGTEKRSAVAISEAIESVGGDLNAFTEKELTCYYAEVLDTDLPLAIEVVSDVVLNALCAEADMDTERDVILEEIAIHLDNAEDLADNTFGSIIFGANPVRLPILGTQDSIKSMKRAALYDFYRQHYTLPNMVVAVAGNIHHDHVLELVHTAFNSRLTGPATPFAARHHVPTCASTPGGQLIARQHEGEQAHLMMGVPAFDRHDPRQPALGVLSTILGGGSSSRLFQEVRERRGLAYSVGSVRETYADVGYFGVYAGCRPAQLGSAVKTIHTVLADVADNGLSLAEVARGKGQLRGRLVLSLEDVSSRMDRIGHRELLYGNHLTLEESLALIDGVTPEQVSELAKELLTRPMSAVVVGPYAAVDALPVELHEVIS